MYRKALWIVSTFSFIAVMSTATMRADDGNRKVSVQAIALQGTPVPPVPTDPGNSSALGVAEPPPVTQSTGQPLVPTAGLISETALFGVTCVGIAVVLFLLRRRTPYPT